MIQGFPPYWLLMLGYTLGATTWPVVLVIGRYMRRRLRGRRARRNYTSGR